MGGGHHHQPTYHHQTFASPAHQGLAGGGVKATGSPGFPGSGCSSSYQYLPNTTKEMYQISSPGGAAAGHPGFLASPPQTSFHPNMMSTPAVGTQVD